VKQWDVFVSHASEDKLAVASPLCHALRAAGVRVWLDTCEIRLGDSIRQKIDEGLSKSRFGVAILSPAFFDKDWPQGELDALYAKKAVLPVWHGLDEATLLAHSPLLASRKGISTSLGLEAVARVIAERVFAPGAATTVDARTFATLLARDPPRDELLDSLENGVLSRALHLSKGDALRTDVQLGPFAVDFCGASYQPSAMSYGTWRLIFCGSPKDPLLDEKGAPSSELQGLLDRARAIRQWVRTNTGDAREVLPALRLDYEAVIVAGRRAPAETNQAAALAKLNAAAGNVRVRTYDWLLDAALSDEK